jgi:exoribonuclease-2
VQYLIPEFCRSGYAKWGVVLGYEYTYAGSEVVKTLLSSGEALNHPARDIQFSVAKFASPELARRAGMGIYADESNPVATESRIQLGKALRSLSRRIEKAARVVQSAAKELYKYARHPDGKTWTKITLADGVALVAGDGTSTLELTYAVHQHFMEDSLHYIAETFEHRLSNTFSVRPSEHVESMQRVISWARSNDPVLDEFASKARVIIEASQAQKRKSAHEAPAWVESKGNLPQLNDADRDIINFIRHYLRQRRELQVNPCILALPLILSKISLSYLPLIGHTAFRVLEDLTLFAPWANHIYQDVDLQLDEFTDTLDTPLPHSTSAVVPVTVNDDRISRTKIVDGLDNMRHDFGDLAVYVIDDSSAEELDDGISIERATDGSDNVWLHVHIADPTSVLRPDDPVALDAARRTATAYFPECTYPMLPLTELSLNALVGREKVSMNVLTFSLLVNPLGDIIDYAVRASVVRRVHILRYDDVTRALGESLIEPLWPFGEPKDKLPKEEPRPVPPSSLPDLQLLHQVTQNLAKNRISKTDSVLWSQPRAVISMDKVRLLTDRDPRPIPRLYSGFPQVGYFVQLGTMEDPRHSLDLSRSMVAECMIAAGRVASLFAQEHGIPMIYRSLARPTGVAADKYQPLLAKRDPYQGTVLYRDAIVQQLAQVTAQPMLTPAVHWQLGISDQEGYVRATSPLRRYLDMLCHWQIKAALHPKSLGAKPPFSTDDLKVLMMKQHLQEQARRRAGNTSIRLWAMRYIQNQITNGGHETLRSLEAIIVDRPLNMANSLVFVLPVMIPKLGLPATLTDCNIESPPPVGSILKVEITNIELSYNPRLVVRPRRS